MLKILGNAAATHTIMKLNMLQQKAQHSSVSILAIAVSFLSELLCYRLLSLTAAIWKAQQRRNCVFLHSATPVLNFPSALCDSTGLL